MKSPIHNGGTMTQATINPMISGEYKPDLAHLAAELKKMWHGACDEHRAWLYRDSMWAVEALIAAEGR